MKIKLYLAGVIFLYLICFISVYCQVYGGYATTVLDGDTVIFRANNGQFYDVRLRSIDAPELLQPFGTDCRDLLISKIYARQIRVWLTGRDYYNRSLGELYLLDGTDVALWMIQNGCAWSWKETREKRDIYRAAQGGAQMSRIGLWLQADPEKPEKYRRRMRDEGGS